MVEVDSGRGSVYSRVFSINANGNPVGTDVLNSHITSNINMVVIKVVVCDAVVCSIDVANRGIANDMTL